MRTKTEQSRIDFEAYVSSVTGSSEPIISLHWTGEGYSEASNLESFWRCWTAAQKAILQQQDKPAIRLELVRYLTDGLHIRKWENLGGLTAGTHTLYNASVLHQVEQTASDERKAGIDELVKVLNPYQGACLTILQSAKALYDAGYRKQVAT